MTKTLFPEIINVLKREAAQNSLTAVPDDVLQEFYKDNSPASQQAAPLSTPVQHGAPQSVPNIPVQPISNISQAPVQQTQAPAVNLEQLGWPELQGQANQCGNCKLCTGRTNVVFGDGNINADLMFIGEGPGQDEDIQGLPFVGKAGQLLTKMILAMQFQRQEVYIANIVKCRPPNNRNPEPDEINACLPYLIQQINLVQPKVLVLLGAVPLKALLNKTGITRLHGVWQEFRGIQTMPTFHPSYLLRYPEMKRDAWSDLQKVMTVFGKTPAPRKVQQGGQA